MEALKFVPFSSSIHPGFWTELTKIKLEVTALKEEPIDIIGTYTISDPPASGLPARLSVDWNAFEKRPEKGWNMYSVTGTITIKNTVESFKSEDKTAFIKREGENVWNKVTQGSWLNNPEDLIKFAILMFADLKKYMFYYWFAFPAFNIPSSVQIQSCQELNEALNVDQVQSLGEALRNGNSSIYSLLLVEGNTVKFVPLNQIDKVDLKSSFVCVADPSSMTKNAGWPLRNLVAALCHTYPNLIHGLRILCLRAIAKDGHIVTNHSLIITLDGQTVQPTDLSSSIVGWEKNDKGQLGPKLANMRSTMDPTKLAESSVNLNLKLMKWRLVPELDLEKVMKSKCLLLGSGTLGCGVARNLLGWGIKHITFVDNGKVSFSNPVRQTLFTFEDCLNGGKPKAIAAAERLKLIFPGVNTCGYNISIPMPGHVVSKTTEAEVLESFKTLERLIDEHDLIFLLMDSRESRWLPTLMASKYCDKLVINAALGFDTFLVMRHGIRVPSYEKPLDSVKGLVPGEMLGCYFCNDVVAPGDSTTDRTLDQQCTVTRPGSSGVASALAVELAVSCLVHPLGSSAPAVVGGVNETVESVLGCVPHTIRGSLHNFSQYSPTGPAFSQCTACSHKVLEVFDREGFELIRKVGENPKYLEDITGLTALMCDSDLMDGVMDLNDDDTFSVSSCDM